MSETRTIVVGGGIVGLSAAYFLSRRGARVALFERERFGEGASGGNAGILALGHPPLPKPGILRQLARVFFEPTNPLYVAPRLDPSLIPWVAGFLAACRPAVYDRSLGTLARLGFPAGECVRRLVEEESIDCEYGPRGWLEVFRRPLGLEHEREAAGRLRGLGYEVEIHDGRALREREPAFRDEVAGAVHYVDSAFAHPGKLVAGLARAAARHGAELQEGTEVVETCMRDGAFAAVRLADGRVVEGDRLVLAAGAWTTALAKACGIRVPMQGGKGYHLELRGTPVRPSTTCVLAETFVAVTPLDGGLRLAGTVELAGLDRSINERRLGMLRRGARDYLHGIDAAREAGRWCGLRPLTADGLPALGWAPGVGGVYIATGHAMMGFLLGPLSGRLAAEAILDGRPSIEVDALSPGRF